MVNRATKHRGGMGWLEGNNLNKSYLDRYYLLISVTGCVGFLNYLYWARRYVYRQPIHALSSRDACLSEPKGPLERVSQKCPRSSGPKACSSESTRWSPHSFQNVRSLQGTSKLGFPVASPLEQIFMNYAP
ncbi:Proton-dependent oligopeptide transporter family [Cinnamomum micranthum f. kanehirae]|uniref:Proton-dependent oligopeptide transporter family n=1 Tax=Cinnamomum micranthum f. kanehirae TaxID=337451 RepID=A0A443PD88_9MAGN|nr:Proton-dependent oligopeptide transporter family [Cinnamomum micranthum f. kanehirae]